jgi:NAD(P)-dependent dehydrogenase (short-subunit alcohol dehydrogenase family)
VTSHFAGRSAIVTGAGSGIGAELSRALTAAGALVVCADLDLDAATAVAGPIGARAVRLDVTDAAAVQALVDEVEPDLMFNNAGITFGGETEDLTLGQWDAIIDVNIRGVVHGVAAAYPLMVRRGHGQIVNTASMGGLMAAGLITSG